MLLQFCPACESMLYVRTNDQGTHYHCRRCAHSQAIQADAEGPAVCITDTLVADDSIRYMRYVSPLLHSDPTMPRVSNIPCQNEKCTRPAGAEHEVVVVKYNYDHLKFLYSCAHCGTYWVTG